ncbi:MAG: PAS domain S-box protein [Desulfobulbaceae bacterium]|nr:PAS domain S-box protein [Desulfobulbaceae bacterium]
MAMITSTAIGMVFLGIALLSAAIAGGVRLNRDVPAELRGRWLMMTIFMVFFDLGYMAFVFQIASGLNFPLELLVGLILVGGAIFVFLFVKVSEYTVLRMNTMQAEAVVANAQLRERNLELAEEMREREAVSQELRRSKIQLENVFNNSIPICITNIRREITIANPVYWQIFGLPADGVLLKCYESRPGSTCKTKKCPFTQIMAGAPEVICESRKANADGSETVFMVTARPYLDEEGQIAGIVESFQDISELKIIEEALAWEKERLLVTLKSIADGVITTDVRGRVVLINDTAQNLTGWSQPYAAGRAVGEILHLSDAENRRLGINPVAQVLRLELEEEVGRRAVLVARDGWERLVNYSVSPIYDRKQEVVGAILVFQDITDKLRSEVEMARVQKLESVGVLAGGIAHDFNNILTAVMNSLALARLAVDKKERLLERLDSTEKAILRARELTGQLLTFAKGGAPLKKIISIADLVKDAVEFNLRGSNVAAIFRVEEHLWPVEVDSAQMHQVFGNLTLNAAQAMPQGGTLVVGLSNCEVAEGEEGPVTPGSYVKIAVADTGVGIEAGHLARIFDPYFTTKSTGTGLGLATAHSIVARHGGFLLVDSQVGEGTVFTIYLPALQGQEVGVGLPEVTEELPGVANCGGRILIMDDDPEILELLSELLRQEGYRAVAVDDGRGAIREYRNSLERGEGFDCLIIDLTIPGGMGGREAMARIRELDPAARAIVSSGYSNDPVLANFAEYGFCGRVAKPYQIEELLRVLERVLAAK